jgi:hypothetical protein
MQRYFYVMSLVVLMTRKLTFGFVVYSHLPICFPYLLSPSFNYCHTAFLLCQQPCVFVGFRYVLLLFRSGCIDGLINIFLPKFVYYSMPIIFVAIYRISLHRSATSPRFLWQKSMAVIFCLYFCCC